MTQSSVANSSVTTSVDSMTPPAVVTSTEDHGHSTLIITLSVLVSITVILILIIIVLVIVVRLRRQPIYRLQQELNVSLPHPSRQPKLSHPCKVFIVTDKNSESIRRLCHHLAGYNIDQVYYQYAENDRHNGPGQLGIGGWIERSFTESDMVLFVCTRGFKKVWENDKDINKSDPCTLIISTTKQLFYGYLSTQEFSKFVVILLQESDHCHIPHILKNVRCFTLNDKEDLVRYISEVPTHVPPRVN